MKKTIQIKFVGFWPGFDEENNIITNILKKHYNIELSENPKYLFSSCFSDEYINYECVRIFYTGENLFPDFNLFDYAIGYEYLELSDRYLRYPNYAIPEIYSSDCELMKHKQENVDEIDKLKDEFCAFVVSKGKGYVAKERENFFWLLSDYKRVNSGGVYLNNINQPRGVENKLAFQKHHKFVIAFENSSHPGYSTEKIVQAYAAKAIPIYWGDPAIDSLFNEKSFINCHRYSSWDEVVAEVERIDNDMDEYKKMISQQALLDDRLIDNYNEKLEEFLVNIIEQDLDKAFRRDTVGYGKMRQDSAKEEYFVKKSCIYKACKFVLNKWSRIK